MASIRYADNVTGVTVEEAKERLAELIQQVREGESIVITDGGQPVARLVATQPTVDWEERLQDLERRGIIRRGKGAPPKLEPLPDPIVPSGVLDALLEERREGW